MHILHVIRTLDPGWGGPVEGLRNLAEQAMELGHDLEVVCPDDPGSSWLSSWKPKVHPVGPARLGRYGFAAGLDRWLAGNLARFDVVVVHSIWMHFSFAVWKATRRVEIPYFLFIHGALDPWFKRNYPGRHIKKTLYWKLFEHKVLRDAERVLFTTTEEMILADRAFLPWKCRPEVSGYGIARPGLPDVPRALAETHPLLANRRFVLFLGRIHEKKGIDLVLRAFAASKSSLPNTALVIAGSGDTNILADLRQLASCLGIAGDVVWAGPLYGDAKWSTLRAAEAYILPSHQENFGISVVEALACGVPVLVSDKVNIWREIQSENAGFVAPDDVAGTVRLLNQWAALSPADRCEMALNAQRCFENHFDIAVTSGRHFGLLAGGLVRSPRATASAQAIGVDR
jgi:glycosyltransferase involved in cell wall biosynthesis